MTLVQMRDRLDSIIAENARRGWPERNLMPVGIEMAIYGKPRKNGRRSFKSRYYAVENIRSLMLTVGGINFGCTTTATENDEIKPKSLKES